MQIFFTQGKPLLLRPGVQKTPRSYVHIPQFSLSPLFCTTAKHCFIDAMCIRGQTPVIAMDIHFPSGNGFILPCSDHFTPCFQIRSIFQGLKITIKEIIIEQFIDYTKTYWASTMLLALCYVGVGVDARLNKTHFLPFKDILALTGHHLPLLETPWWNWKDLPGLAWCNGGAVCMRVAGVVRFTHIGHTASHSRDKVAVMLLTLAVSLPQMGREQNGFH